jgi:HAMP domain-containing protein
MDAAVRAVERVTESLQHAQEVPVDSIESGAGPVPVPDAPGLVDRRRTKGADGEIAGERPDHEPHAPSRLAVVECAVGDLWRLDQRVRTEQTQVDLARRQAGRARGAADGATRSADAPALPAATFSSFWTGVGRGLQLRFDIGGSGDCAIGLARMLPRPGQLRDQLVAVALVVLSVLGGVWVAAGPVISRMRRLADEVRQSAASSYVQPVHAEHDDEVSALARAFNDAGATVRAQLTEIQAREETLR